MPYKLRIPENEVFGKSRFTNAAGNTECVEFVRQATNAPHTTLWRKGAHVMGTACCTIPRGTAIATFDENGKYPTDAHGKHAAIYLTHDATGIRVLDQWNKQGEVRERKIQISPPDFPRVNAAKHYCVIE